MVVMLKSDSESPEAEVDRRQEGDRREARSSSRMRPSKMILRLPDSSYERSSGLLKRRVLLISVAGLFALNGACGAVFSAIELRREMERARDVRAEWDRVLLITGSSKHNLTRMDIEWMRSTYRKANSDVEMGCGKCDRAREGSARDKTRLVRPARRATRDAPGDGRARGAKFSDLSKRPSKGG